MPGGDGDTIMGRLEALGIDMRSRYGSCARARNTSVRVVGTSDFKDCRRSSIAIEALQRPGCRRGTRMFLDRAGVVEGFGDDHTLGTRAC